jgi:ribonuclease Y
MENSMENLGDNLVIVAVLTAAGLIIVFLLGWFIGRQLERGRYLRAQRDADRIVADAQKEAETMFREKLLELKDEQIRLKSKHDAEHRQKLDEIARSDRSVRDREANLKNRIETADRRSKELDKLQQELGQREKNVGEKEAVIDSLVEEQKAALERVGQMTQEEALAELKGYLVEKAREQTSEMVRELRDRARQQANREAKEIIVSAIQRTAADHSVETTVSVVNLPSDEIKGRIIGREGRNIRAFEQATGVDIIVDDTPEAVIISAFDPLRREVARRTLEKLISDGRIHPARIEELVKKCEKELDEELIEAGENAALEVGVAGAHGELIKLLGRLKYRTSYGQNCLQHSIEVAHLAGLMAAQLGLDAKMAKRAGLLHDVGKAMDRYTEGTHVTIGLELAKKYREPKVVQNAIAAHHGDAESTSLIGVLVQACDAVSSSRPGARRETLEAYIQRLEKLEELTNSFPGVQKCFAVQAGREIRVIVEPEKVNDAGAESLANDIAERIQGEMEYPGQIRVTVVREFRAVEFAK